MTKIERKEIMIGVHYTVDIHGDVAEDYIETMANQLSVALEAEMLVGRRMQRATGVTVEEIRGGETTGIPDLVISATPDAWPVGSLIKCIEAQREGEADLYHDCFYKLQQVNHGFGTVDVVHLFSVQTVSADRFLYIYSPREKVGNGNS